MNTASASGTRTYSMTARAKAAEATGERILDAARGRFSTLAFDDVTLNDIAADAGVSVQTVIRRFGSKEELFATLAERETSRILAERQPPVGDGRDLEQALETLVEHYERDGDTVLNLLAQESRFPLIAEIVAQGRRFHEEWVVEHCSAVLGPPAERERKLLAVVVATDLYTWKLLRRDRGLSPQHVIETMTTLLEGLRKTGEQ